MANMLNDLYLPDGKRLTTILIGAAGSGKSFMTKHTLLSFMKQNDDENLRVIFCCPKHEMDLGEDTYTPMHKLEKHLSKNRIAVVYPDPLNVEEETDWLINLVFEIKEANPDFKCVLCVDDSQIFLSSRREPSAMWKRLALTGRSRGIRMVVISHAPVFSKVLEGSTSYIVHFRSLLSPLHVKDFQNRYGYDPEPYIEPLNEVSYSHVFFDVTSGKTSLMRPIEV